MLHHTLLQKLWISLQNAQHQLQRCNELQYYSLNFYSNVEIVIFIKSNLEQDQNSNETAYF